jgi:hypothetical protein
MSVVKLKSLASSPWQLVGTEIRGNVFNMPHHLAQQELNFCNNRNLILFSLTYNLSAILLKTVTILFISNLSGNSSPQTTQGHT